VAKIEVRWSLNSFKDLEQITEFISVDSPLYAPMFIKKIIHSVDRLELFPLSGRIVPEYEDEAIREIIFHNYRIIYRIKKDIIEVSSISHSAKLLN